MESEQRARICDEVIVKVAVAVVGKPEAVVVLDEQVGGETLDEDELLEPVPVTTEVRLSAKS